MKIQKCYINKQTQERAKELGYPIDVIAKEKPKKSVKLGETDCFVRWAKGDKNYLVAKEGKELVYEEKEIVA